MKTSRLVFLLPVSLSLALIACQSPSYGNDSILPKKSTMDSSVSTPTINNVDNSAVIIAPWTNLTISNNETDNVYRQQWMQAESKSLCPILALPRTSAAHLTNAKVRRAEFAGGWGVAYDLPNIRSAYGVANTGTIDPKDLSYSWPCNISYSDGSTVGYGHEGGDPKAKWLAYLVTAQNNCFYNVWSAQGKSHLEQIIADLRQVRP